MDTLFDELETTLPNGWRLVKLGNVLEYVSVRAKDISNTENLPFFGVSNTDGLISAKYASEEKAEDYKIIKQGYFAYNPYRINVGSIAYVEEDICGLISPAYVIFKTKPNSIRPELLLRFLKSNAGLQQIQEQARGTVRQALRFEDLCKLELYIPSYDAQHILVERLNKTSQSVNIFTQQLEQQLQIIQQLRQAFLREAMQGKLVEQSATDEPATELLARIATAKANSSTKRKAASLFDAPPRTLVEDAPFDIPANWVWCRLGEICNKIGSGSTPKGGNYSSKGVPFFRSQNIHNSGLVYDDITFISDDVHEKMKGTTVYPNDILLNITGGSMGRVALVPDDSSFKEGNVSQHVCIIRGVLINVSFLHYIILAPYFQTLIFNSTTGAGREGLPKYNLEKFYIPLPPLAEQTRIVEKLDELMSVCDALQRNVENGLMQLRALQQVALSEALQMPSE